MGDRYVLEMLQQTVGSCGESSGHIICLDRTTTGDAIIAALQVLEVLVEQQFTCAMPSMYEQISADVGQCAHRAKINIEQSKLINEAVNDAETQLADRGRVLLRPSGTRAFNSRHGGRRRCSAGEESGRADCIGGFAGMRGSRLTIRLH